MNIINCKEKNGSLNNVWNTFLFGSLLAFLAVFLFGSAQIEARQGKVKNVRTGEIFNDLQIAIDNALSGDTLKIRGTFVTSGDPFFITKSLNFIGVHDAVLDGNNLTQVITTTTSGLVITFEHLTIRHGNTTADGGGIENGSGNTMTLNSVIVVKNTTTGNGGGISNFGNLIINQSKIVDNKAASGGGIFDFAGATLTIDESEIEGNIARVDGGGIYIVDGTNTISDSEIEHNSAENGGGVFAQGGVNTFNNDKISDNHATNNGGGVYNDTLATAIFNSCKISSNTASRLGGGLFNLGIAHIFSSKVTDNIASEGGGIYNAGIGNLVIEGSEVEDNKPNDITSV